MPPSTQPLNFQHIHTVEIRRILAQALEDMTTLLAQTSCNQAAEVADTLNERKKQAFTQLYAIGHETMERKKSEEVLKAIRLLQDAFARIINAVSNMAEVTHDLNHRWTPTLQQSGQ